MIISPKCNSLPNLVDFHPFLTGLILPFLRRLLILRIIVRKTLQRWKYPPDDVPEVVKFILKQVEVLSNAWTH
ncbi:DUF3387 domain-containing protein [Hydrogenovibrio sp. JE_KL2]|nr:DUF3387 domain-containing protein [Hydrogenovibrio sp. JE_KL2]